MATVLKISGNFLVIYEDTVYKEYIRNVLTETTFKRDENDKFTFFYKEAIFNSEQFTDVYILGNEWRSFLYSDLIDITTGLPFPDADTLESLLNNNLGIAAGGGGGGGLTYVATDATLNGDGTPAFPLSVVQGTGLSTKSGKVLNPAFVGTPKIATVTFVAPFTDSDYSPVITCETINNSSYVPNVENITANGFDINMSVNNISHLVSVYWIAIKFGETT